MHAVKFFDYVKSKFNNKYDYSKFQYINANTKSIIICPSHGDFLQTPYAHKLAKIGCPHCTRISKTTTLKTCIKIPKPVCSYTKFIKLCNVKFANKFQYRPDGYIGKTQGSLIVICPNHGEQIHTPPINHYQSQTGCKLCGLVSSSNNRTTCKTNILDNFRQLHKNSYSYPNFESMYKNTNSKILIHCPVHNVTFKKRVRVHLNGSGCERCMYDNLITSGIIKGGYCDDYFIRNPQDKTLPCTLYYIEFNGGKLYKIGITTVSARSRAVATRSLSNGYITDFKILYEQETTLYDAYIKEQQILKLGAPHRILRKWCTEIFNTDVRDIPEVYTILYP